jgi:hypothetical protein
MESLFTYLVPIALGAVFVTLCFGIFAMFRGGQFGRTWSNRMMRLRVLTQFVAILVLIGALLAKEYWPS